MKYSFKKGLVKGIISFVIFSIPMLINYFPVVANLTIGAGLMILVNFIKVKYIR